MELEFHPASEIFELIEGVEFDALVENVGKHGLINDIWLHPDGTILDGRNRYRACLEAGVEPRFQTWDGIGFAADFVWALNATRRHLEGNARKIAAAKYAIELEREAKERQGKRTDLTLASNEAEVTFGKSSEHAAEKFNESRATVERAVKVVKDGAPELVKAVERGEVSVAAAADVATLPKQEQAEIVARGEKEILEAAKQIRAEKAEVRRAERIERIVEIAKGNTDLSTDTKYPVIYADPPWRYDYAETENRAIENQYPTMTIDEICNMPVSDLATDDAILFMWTTAPKLEEAFKVVSSWGFTYRSCAIWDKQKIGMGYYFRIQHEILLVATRGNIPTPAPADRVSSVISIPRSEHSAKPVDFYEIIEKFYPALPKIELFCRSPREGWAVWGNQSSEAA
jgi:N6-adenosine-specific RNA methylase IME4